ncbi:hypothetical protein Rs2_37090 [Raphanus sativus]|nr:hypothetical protein Rs2_37090 [Raphanus sativus]
MYIASASVVVLYPTRAPPTQPQGLRGNTISVHTATLLGAGREVLGGGLLTEGLIIKSLLRDFSIHFKMAQAQVQGVEADGLIPQFGKGSTKAKSCSIEQDTTTYKLNRQTKKTQIDLSCAS